MSKQSNRTVQYSITYNDYTNENILKLKNSVMRAFCSENIPIRGNHGELKILKSILTELFDFKNELQV